MEKSIGRLVSILFRKNQIYLNNELKEYKITASELAVILNLYKNEGFTQDELATYMMLDKAAITRTIPLLEEKGFIRREKDSKDKRANRIFLNQKSRDLEKEFIEILQGWSRFLTDGMDQEKVMIMVEILEAMVSRVEESDLKKIRRK